MSWRSPGVERHDLDVDNRAERRPDDSEICPQRLEVGDRFLRFLQFYVGQPDVPPQALCRERQARSAVDRIAAEAGKVVRDDEGKGDGPCRRGDGKVEAWERGGASQG